VKALVFERNLPRFAASRLASVVGGSGKGVRVGPLRISDVEEPALPAPGWYRVRPSLAGICGSDLATLDGRSSRYFEDIVSFPFVPGHEVVGEIIEVAPPADGDGAGALSVGTRVVVEPVLGCIPRGIVPPCPPCAMGRTGGCERIAFGHLAPGLQIGYCTDTGGGWSMSGLVAHGVQLHRVPDDFSDEDAVMVEPTACAVHAALEAEVEPGDNVVVIGAGTLGLTVVSALRQLTAPGAIVVGAKYAQQKRLAAQLGADVVVDSAQLARTIRHRTGSLSFSGHLTGGADVVIDCVGSAQSLEQSLAVVRPRGRIVLVGMPGKVHIDLASLWHREVALAGAYAYGTEDVGGQLRRTFDLAIEVVRAASLGQLVSARYPIDRFEEAVAHAAEAGRRGAVKIVFDLDSHRRHRADAGAPPHPDLADAEHGADARRGAP
jgi:threonine dehydrogenase-like Zn-dependent dehydrogenase